MIYSPFPGFTGTDTFTYTVSDGALTEVVDVSVTVAPSDNPPTAVDDSFTVTEDSAEAAFDVLANDIQDVDNQTFVIDSIGTPTQGGSVSISPDGSQFLYAPAANFAGTEEVTYTIQDTGGGLSVGTVTFTVTGVNDAPPIANPTVGVNRGAGESVVFSLSDLPENVDDNETLTITTVSASTTAGGSARIDGDSIQYTPPSADFTGTDTFTYSISDGTLTSSGTVTISINDFTTRDIFLSMPSSASQNRINNIVLRGTNLLGETVEVPLTYTDDSALFDDVLPGDYTIEIPAIPFLQNAEEPRQIPLTSGAEDGDVTIDSGVGRLRPEFLSIRDWLGSAPSQNILVAVAPGETSSLTLLSPSTTIIDPVVELDDSGDNVIIRGTSLDAITALEDDVEATVPTSFNQAVQSRGESGGVRLLRISVEETDVTFTSSSITSSATAEGESVSEAVQASTTVAAIQPVLQATSQAEGEAIAASITQADLFVPATSDASSRTDAAVLVTEDGELWTGQSLQAPSDTFVTSAQSVDSVMDSVAPELSIVSAAGDEIATESVQSNALDETAIDAALSDEI